MRAPRRIDEAVHASALALVERLIASGPQGAPAGSACDVPDRAGVSAGL
jgi:hypothetical protein